MHTLIVNENGVPNVISSNQAAVVAEIIEHISRLKPSNALEEKNDVSAPTTLTNTADC